MAYRKNNKKHQSGFTLIEVIAVLVIIAVLAAVVISRMTSPSSFGLVSETDILKGHLRYAQYRAMSDVTLWYMSFTANTYTLWHYDSSVLDWKPSTLPNEESGTHSLEKAGVTLTVNDGGDAFVYFNEWGNPVTDTGDLLPDTTTISLKEGSTTQTVKITQNTGFIE